MLESDFAAAAAASLLGGTRNSLPTGTTGAPLNTFYARSDHVSAGNVSTGGAAAAASAATAGATSSAYPAGVSALTGAAEQRSLRGGVFHLLSQGMPAVTGETLPTAHAVSIPQPPRMQQMLRHGDHLLRLLHGLATRSPVGAPYYLHLKGGLEWRTGRPALATLSWLEGARIAKAHHNKYLEALMHYALCRPRCFVFNPHLSLRDAAASFLRLMELLHVLRPHPANPFFAEIDECVAYYAHYGVAVATMQEQKEEEDAAWAKLAAEAKERRKERKIKAKGRAAAAAAAAATAVIAKERAKQEKLRIQELRLQQQQLYEAKVKELQLQKQQKEQQPQSQQQQQQSHNDVHPSGAAGAPLVLSVDAPADQGSLIRTTDTTANNTIADTPHAAVNSIRFIRYNHSMSAAGSPPGLAGNRGPLLLAPRAGGNELTVTLVSGASTLGDAANSNANAATGNMNINEQNAVTVSATSPMWSAPFAIPLSLRSPTGTNTGGWFGSVANNTTNTSGDGGGLSSRYGAFMSVSRDTARLGTPLAAAGAASFTTTPLFSPQSADSIPSSAQGTARGHMDASHMPSFAFSALAPPGTSVDVAQAMRNRLLAQLQREGAADSDPDHPHHGHTSTVPDGHGGQSRASPDATAAGSGGGGGGSTTTAGNGSTTHGSDDDVFGDAHLAGDAARTGGAPTHFRSRSGTVSEQAARGLMRSALSPSPGQTYPVTPSRFGASPPDNNNSSSSSSSSNGNYGDASVFTFGSTNTAGVSNVATGGNGSEHSFSRSSQRSIPTSFASRTAMAVAEAAASAHAAASRQARRERVLRRRVRRDWHEGAVLLDRVRAKAAERRVLNGLGVGEGGAAGATTIHDTGAEVLAGLPELNAALAEIRIAALGKARAAEKEQLNASKQSRNSAAAAASDGNGGHRSARPDRAQSPAAGPQPLTSEALERQRREAGRARLASLREAAARSAQVLLVLRRLWRIGPDPVAARRTVAFWRRLRLFQHPRSARQSALTPSEAQAAEVIALRRTAAHTRGHEGRDMCSSIGGNISFDHGSPGSNDAFIPSAAQSRGGYNSNDGDILTARNTNTTYTDATAAFINAGGGSQAAQALARVEREKELKMWRQRWRRRGVPWAQMPLTAQSQRDWETGSPYNSADEGFFDELAVLRKIDDDLDSAWDSLDSGTDSHSSDGDLGPSDEDSSDSDAVGVDIKKGPAATAGLAKAKAKARAKAKAKAKAEAMARAQATGFPPRPSSRLDYSCSSNSDSGADDDDGDDIDMFDETQSAKRSSVSAFCCTGLGKDAYARARARARWPGTTTAPTDSDRSEDDNDRERNDAADIEDNVSDGDARLGDYDAYCDSDSDVSCALYDSRRMSLNAGGTGGPVTAAATPAVSDAVVAYASTTGPATGNTSAPGSLNSSGPGTATGSGSGSSNDAVFGPRYISRPRNSLSGQSGLCGQPGLFPSRAPSVNRNEHDAASTASSTSTAYATLSHNHSTAPFDSRSAESTPAVTNMFTQWGGLLPDSGAPTTTTMSSPTVTAAEGEGDATNTSAGTDAHSLNPAPGRGSASQHTSLTLPSGAMLTLPNGGVGVGAALSSVTAHSQHPQQQRQQQQQLRLSGTTPLTGSRTDTSTNTASRYPATLATPGSGTGPGTGTGTGNGSGNNARLASPGSFGSTSGSVSGASPVLVHAAAGTLSSYSTTDSGSTQTASAAGGWGGSDSASPNPPHHHHHHQGHRGQNLAANGALGLGGFSSGSLTASASASGTLSGNSCAVASSPSADNNNNNNNNNLYNHVQQQQPQPQGGRPIGASVFYGAGGAAPGGVVSGYGGMATPAGRAVHHSHHNLNANTSAGAGSDADANARGVLLQQQQTRYASTGGGGFGRGGSSAMGSGGALTGAFTSPAPYVFSTSSPASAAASDGALMHGAGASNHGYHSARGAVMDAVNNGSAAAAADAAANGGLTGAGAGGLAAAMSASNVFTRQSGAHHGHSQGHGHGHGHGHPHALSQASFHPSVPVWVAEPPARVLPHSVSYMFNPQSQQQQQQQQQLRQRQEQRKQQRQAPIRQVNSTEIPAEFAAAAAAAAAMPMGADASGGGLTSIGGLSSDFATHALSPDRATRARELARLAQLAASDYVGTLPTIASVVDSGASISAFASPTMPNNSIVGGGHQTAGQHNANSNPDPSPGGSGSGDGSGLGANSGYGSAIPSVSPTWSPDTHYAQTRVAANAAAAVDATLMPDGTAMFQMNADGRRGRSFGLLSVNASPSMLSLSSSAVSGMTGAGSVSKQLQQQQQSFGGLQEQAQLALSAAAMSSQLQAPSQTVSQAQSLAQSQVPAPTQSRSLHVTVAAATGAGDDDDGVVNESELLGAPLRVPATRSMMTAHGHTGIASLLAVPGTANAADRSSANTTASAAAADGFGRVTTAGVNSSPGYNGASPSYGARSNYGQPTPRTANINGSNSNSSNSVNLTAAGVNSPPAFELISARMGWGGDGRFDYNPGTAGGVGPVSPSVGPASRAGFRDKDRGEWVMTPAPGTARTNSTTSHAHTSAATASHNNAAPGDANNSFQGVTVASATAGSVRAAAPAENGMYPGSSARGRVSNSVSQGVNAGNSGDVSDGTGVRSLVRSMLKPDQWEVAVGSDDEHGHQQYVHRLKLQQQQ